MARAGIYRTEVLNARNVLIAKGIHPSIDAVRIELGNTGSKTTISKYLRELEVSHPVHEGAPALTETLTRLVSQLAAGLQEENAARIEAAKADAQRDVAEIKIALDASQREHAALRVRFREIESRYQDEQDGHEKTKAAHTQARLAVQQLQERLSAAEQRVAERAKTIALFEEKQRQFQTVMDNLRNANSEARDRDQKRHEQQLAEGQAALRQANETIGAKTLEVLQLHRDNARLTEQVAQFERSTLDHRAQALRQTQEIHALKNEAKEVTALRGRLAQAQEDLERWRRGEVKHASAAVS